MSVEEKMTVVEQLHKPDGRVYFADLLSNITRPLLIESSEAFKGFAEIVSYLLSTYMLEKNVDGEILLVVLNVSRNIYAKVVSLC